MIQYQPICMVKITAETLIISHIQNIRFNPGLSRRVTDVNPLALGVNPRLTFFDVLFSAFCFKFELDFKRQRSESSSSVSLCVDESGNVSLSHRGIPKI